MLDSLQELLILTYCLLVEVLLPEFSEQIKNMGAKSSFDPTKDVPSLDGKVIVVTGGKFSRAARPTIMWMNDMAQGLTDECRQCGSW